VKFQRKSRGNPEDIRRTSGGNPVDIRWISGGYPEEMKRKDVSSLLMCTLLERWNRTMMKV
jgi:hypothetical protein